LVAPEWLAVAVAAASFTIILLALAAVGLDIRDQRRSALEADRMRGLADAAVEGLVVCNNELAVTVNRSFAELVGSTSDVLVNKPIQNFIPDVVTRVSLFENPDKPIEANLRHVNGTLIPVELILREIDFGGTPHHVIAVRNLQARKQAEQHIHYLAHHDSLTGLPNRATFTEQLDREIAALPADKKLAVLYLDLDRFKEVNDLFGHAAGDRVLKTVASRIPNVLRSSGMLARLGGDEFAMVVTDLKNGPATAGRLAEEIIAALRGPTNDTDDSISCSIGIAIYPDDASSRESLLSQADTALYRAKGDGRSTYRFFETKMGLEVRDRRMLEHDLRLAIPRGELALVYQPQEDIKSNTTTGFEALLRWTHGTRGPVPPSVFIPIAEESGAIVSIGEWVLREACREAASWKQPLTIAVNVSAVQLYTENFVQLVHGVLLETGLPPSRLELEITETALVRDFNRALAALRQLKALGISIAMDDFGTGYSSLSNLRAFPFDKIKIDGSFIKSVHTNDQAATIVRAVLGLGRGLGLPVLAEGVETSAELNFLQAEFCDEVQGYFVGRPAAIENFAAVTTGEDTALPVTQPVVLARSA
jgi:diguanylate cyclase (GGDEF)-like protein/PAS domain S-box-containing protein